MAGVAEQVPRVVDPLVDRGAGRLGQGDRTLGHEEDDHLREQSEDERPRGELPERDDGKGGCAGDRRRNGVRHVSSSGMRASLVDGLIGHAGLTSPLINGAEAMSQ